MADTHSFGVLQSSGKKKRGTCASFQWPVCKRCGLVLLMNRATELARKARCEGLEDKDG
jgi:hypothetical protein